MIDSKRLIGNFLSLASIEGVSSEEQEAMEEVKRRLDRLGIEHTQDNAGERFGGSCGNVIAKVPAAGSAGAPFFMSAHVDTIQSSKGTPHIKDGVIYSDGNSVLGADDRAGVAQILEIIESAREQNLEHPDITLLFLVGEEIGLYGSKYLDYSQINCSFGFVFDSSADFGKIVSHAPTQLSFVINVLGKAAHGAIAPELGIHAIKIAAEAIAKTNVGRVDTDSTVSIGTIHGGTKINVIPDRVEIKGEIRSLNDARIPEYQKKIVNTFERTARGSGGKVTFKWDEAYKGFKLEEGHPLIRWILQAMRNSNIEPELIPFIGGSDANNFNANGIPTVNLGQGYKKNHSTEEYIAINDLAGLAQVGYEIIKLSPQFT